MFSSLFPFFDCPHPVNTVIILKKNFCRTTYFVLRFYIMLYLRTCCNTPNSLKNLNVIYEKLISLYFQVIKL
jgi:hypothetical protein